MEFVAIIIGIVLLVVLYFCIGMVAKFIWGWLPLATGLAVGVGMAIFGGWLGAAIGVFICVALVVGTDRWHSTDLFQRVERGIDKAFHFDD